MLTHNTAEFTFEPKDDTMLVTWGAYMDTMIGKDFEAGLADLKTTAEKP